MEMGELCGEHRIFERSAASSPTSSIGSSLVGGVYIVNAKGFGFDDDALARPVGSPEPSTCVPSCDSRMSFAPGVGSWSVKEDVGRADVVNVLPDTSWDGLSYGDGGCCEVDCKRWFRTSRGGLSSLDFPFRVEVPH